jgi:hypothetical protein
MAALSLALLVVPPALLVVVVRRPAPPVWGVAGGRSLAAVSTSTDVSLTRCRHLLQIASHPGQLLLVQLKANKGKQRQLQQQTHRTCVLT